MVALLVVTVNCVTLGEAVIDELAEGGAITVLHPQIFVTLVLFMILSQIYLGISPSMPASYKSVHVYGSIDVPNTL